MSTHPPQTPGNQPPQRDLDRGMSEIVGTLVALLVLALLWGVLFAVVKLSPTEVHTYEPYKPPQNTPGAPLPEAQPPLVWFSSPLEGQAFMEGDPVPLWGGLRVEPPHRISLVRVSPDGAGWTDAWNDSLSAWDAGALVGLPPGNYTEWALARDWRGLWSPPATVNFTVLPLPPPEVTYISASPDVAACNQQVQFNATARSRLPVVEWWWTDGARNLSGAQNFTAALAIGGHVINLRVRDSAGHWSGWASVNVTVRDPNATAVIDSISPPAARQGEPVTFVGHAQAEYGAFVGYRWVSSIDGVLGYGTALTTSSLSAGRHAITFQALHECAEGWARAAAAVGTVDVQAPPAPCYSCPPGTGARNEVKLGSIKSWTLTPAGGLTDLGEVSWAVVASEGPCYYPGSGTTDAFGWSSVVFEYGADPGDGTVLLQFWKPGYPEIFVWDQPWGGGACIHAINAILSP